MPGVGGTGVVTINALLATAAHIDGLQAITLDQTGVAQKGGAVVAHITISDHPIEASQRIPAGCADLLLGFDLVGSAYPKNLQCCDSERTVALVNSKEILTGEAIRKGLTVLSPDGGYIEAIRKATRRADSEFLNASTLAETLFGGHIFSNMLLLGAAYQKGLLPLSAEAIETAIRLNGVAVERNLEVFKWGRQYVCDRKVLHPYLPSSAAASVPQSLDVLIASREGELTAYQDGSYASAYREFVEKVRQVESRVRPGSESLTRAVAWNLHKLMAYKDEYEVARLLTDRSFDEIVSQTFDKPRRLVYHLHPPLLRRLGFKRKMALGSWIRSPLRVLARAKVLRGTPLDPFGWMAARRQERELIAWYRELVDSLLAGLNAQTFATAVEVAEVAREIRGYEGVKAASVERAKAWVAERLAATPVREAA